MVEITNGVTHETRRCDDRLAEDLCGEGALDGPVDAGDRVIDEGRLRGVGFTKNLRGEARLDGRVEMRDRITDEGRRCGAGFAEDLRGESVLDGMGEVTDRVTYETYHAGQQCTLLRLYPLNLFFGSRRSNIVWRERIRLERRQR